MVLASPEHSSTSCKRLRIGLLVSVSAMMTLVTKSACRVSKKLKTAKNNRNKQSHRHKHSDLYQIPDTQPKSPLLRPKQLLTQISNKATTLMHSSKKRLLGDEHDDGLRPEDFGERGVWQKAILMGGRCEPLDFSGVIYYDSTGKQLKEAPLRSPRASPLPGYLQRAE
ncbi:hypothetical protein K2173_004069 [Erythroxylum novogranatense]|uniref:Uncharacterized protein n=1 Tax=Erythroxylum novogranatense TaxID=1862640 RepID=A0AAV8SKE9_9ROSI|nr:hypothetical protein K2173_004069 [Erythroxylum novogranatense]